MGKGGEGVGSGFVFASSGGRLTHSYREEAGEGGAALCVGGATSDDRGGARVPRLIRSVRNTSSSTDFQGAGASAFDEDNDEGEVVDAEDETDDKIVTQQKLTMATNNTRRWGGMTEKVNVWAGIQMDQYVLRSPLFATSSTRRESPSWMTCADTPPPPSF